MKSLTDKLKSNPIIYVTRDIERAMSIDPDTEGYFIISNNNDFAKQSSVNKKNILLIKEKEILSTAELLKHTDTKEFIKKFTNPSILVFKNTAQIEKICEENKWNLLNPPSKISNKIEEKISQVEIFKSLNEFFLNYKIEKCKDIKWNKEKFILQFNYSHTGSGTVLIDSQEKLDTIKKQFPEREARISDFVEGPIFTNNNALSGNDLIIGNISYQITGIKYFTDKPFSTIGNDWGLVNKLLTQVDIENFKNIVRSVSEKLKELGWKGLFGVDIIMDQKTKKMYLIEVNARQPASTTFESILQNKVKYDGINIFEAHLAGLLNIDTSTEKLIPISNGSQIIKRIIHNNDWSPQITKIINDLKKNNLDVIGYNNKNIGTELLRIQSNQSVMTDHNRLSDIGKKILHIICPNIAFLSNEAQKVIDAYLNLPIKNNFISVPYFNNARQKIRGGLKVFTGKGNPKEIIEEISIIAQKNKINLDKFNQEQTKQLLVDNNIGIDCSGLAYYILNAELKAKTNKSLQSVIKFPTIKNIFRKLIAKLRIVQNVNVLTFAQDENSHSILKKNIKPGDFIVMINAGIKQDRDHIIVITKTNCEYNTPDSTNNLSIKKISYVHSFAWNKDGKYNHGVREGEIEIINENAGLLDQLWTEQCKTNQENETYIRATQAKTLEIRRLNALDEKN
ncbi:MAG: hypothetical protein A2725_03685 [Candidatus Magasanikbacteria bacterium RIFCSPHIGHO2_01_FULL_33_34]|uniref:ATP-grasp domain-containing protein n=1 Tax=Candidatus Magasanikbacteria bacterium RIFCSPHIGHO2_01_FULL_33_34 TaxID=1798671 RepID=A0A1F6LHP9_9BACT|nr:MAG: hypothetical protein A2725_03685 [Candidatus Magasanikbacteria bacterium RIFCSPHIGHO2_01_FULL_33_34]OGH65073.1 MAG: hypothetical protein A3B83_03445 [Candidatus Magasanikbacteria bacterium RIFCSPHIGHO2_02_FULL_33_17]OGH75383.1 MAG: hypothetical protein A3A89_04720 [Candidatus Magasanikbacteria bacterium RIFCSPLOWO2_01_FULL_33_34]